MGCRWGSIGFLVALAAATFGPGVPAQVALGWRQRAPGASPGGRCDCALAFDSLRGRAVLFGGEGPQGLLADTWEWVGDGWQARHPATRPPARSRHAMAFDPVRGRTVLFGGGDGAGPLGDTWEWDGSDWRQSATGPPPRLAHTLVFHAGLGRCVLFGGEGAAGPLGDTWEWDGAAWRPGMALFSPPRRRAHCSAYDPNRDRLDLFGGSDGAKPLADTWEWDTVYWNWLLPAASPSAREGHAMVFHGALGLSLLFGGADATGPLADTWTWDGTLWHAVGPGGPPSRSRHAMVYDTLRGRALLFGGKAASLLADTWEYGTVLEGSFATTGPGCTGSHGKSPVLWHRGRPEIGQGFSLELADAPPARGSLLYLDVLDPALSLAPYGAPGCSASVRPGFLLAWVGHVTPGGVWDPAPVIKVPPAMALLGADFHAQAFIHDPQANPLGVITSNGLKGRIGFAGIGPIELTERFQDAAMLDPDASGAVWGSGRLEPGVLGGSGLLGSFDKDMFVDAAPVGGTLTLSTDSQRVKAAGTLTGQEVLVSGGLFQFEEFHVPAGLTLDFRGANPPRILVRGSVKIEGRIQVDGRPAPAHDGALLLGGSGGPGNCGGAPGGQGALRAAGGQDGAPLAFPPGSARFGSAAARAAAGRGAPAFPGSVPSITYNGYDGWVCAQIGAGGSGGGNAGPGLKGSATLTGAYKPAFLLTDVPPDNGPGSPFPYLPRLSGEPSVLQCLAGGAGGGGGGSSPLGSMKSYTVEWHSGQGGGGGGGALLIRAGRDLAVLPGGALAAAGGDSPDPQSFKRAVPGGGGAGGNILLQLGGAFLCQGAVRAPGGRGGIYDELASYNWGCRSSGGDGGAGYLRVEAPQAPPVGALSGFEPPATADNTGRLEDADAVTGARSRFYRTLLHRPVFRSFLVEALENGLPVAYSDDPKLGKRPLFDPGKGTPVALFLQGARMDAQGAPVAGSLTRWVQSAGALGDPGQWGVSGARPEAVRWVVLFDTSVLPAPATLAVTRVTLFID